MQFWVESGQKTSESGQKTSESGKRSDNSGQNPNFTVLYHLEPLVNPFYSNWVLVQYTYSCLASFKHNIHEIHRHNERYKIVHTQKTLISEYVNIYHSMYIQPPYNQYKACLHYKQVISKR